MTVFVLIDPTWALRDERIFQAVLRRYPGARFRIEGSNSSERRFAALAEIVASVEPGNVRNLVDVDCVAVLSQSLQFPDGGPTRERKVWERGLRAPRVRVLEHWRMHGRTPVVFKHFPRDMRDGSSDAYVEIQQTKERA